LKASHSKSLRLSDQDDSRLTEALSRLTDQSLQHQDTLLRASEQSASVNGDQVIFRTLDSLMVSKKMKQSQLVKKDTLTSEGQQYAKDDMTNYSRAFGANKRSKKGHKRATPLPNSVMYDVDDQEMESEELSNEG
jgi:hypothetical protein